MVDDHTRVLVTFHIATGYGEVASSNDQDRLSYPETLDLGDVSQYEGNDPFIWNRTLADFKLRDSA